MQIQICVPDLPNKTGIRKDDIAYVKRTKTIGSTLYFGVKSPKRGMVWYAQNEVKQV